MSVFARARRNSHDGDDARSQLARSAFWIILDPESGNGHTLFANSDNNGPCGDATLDLDQMDRWVQGLVGLAASQQEPEPAPAS